MRAYLLGGGLGERLRPVTLSLPKCLVPINGVPLLGIWLDLCERHGIRDVLLNVSQFPGLVKDFLAVRRGGPRVDLVIEGAPRGTAGTVAAHRAFVDGADDFWILYADTLTDAALDDMLATHRGHDGVVTMGLFRAPVPSAAGIVDLAPDGRIVGFTEKPPAPTSNLANAGIYAARRELFSAIPSGPLVDFGHDVFPALVTRMFGHVIEQFVLDIGTPTALAAASAAWDRRRDTRSLS